MQHSTNEVYKRMGKACVASNRIGISGGKFFIYRSVGLFLHGVFLGLPSMSNTHIVPCSGSIEATTNESMLSVGVGMWLFLVLVRFVELRHE